MKKVKAKKHLGQHFLINENIANTIALSLINTDKYKTVIEVGPGMGVLTKYLVEQNFTTLPIDVDRESVAYLKEHYPKLRGNIIYGDFLKINLNELVSHENFAVIGNFPYNISSQILFKVLEYKNQVPEVVGMFQKEVAERIAAEPGSKIYGITSVLLQAYYNIEYLFTVNENEFNPPPKVKSAVIRLTRNKVNNLPCDEKFFKTIIKTSFNQRRKTLRNSLKVFIDDEIKSNEVFNCRPEQLSVNQFIELTNLLHKKETNT